MHNKNIHDIGSGYRSFLSITTYQIFFYSPEFVSALLSGAVHENANVWLREFEQLNSLYPASSPVQSLYDVRLGQE